jgi:hypothetical protein
MLYIDYGPSAPYDLIGYIWVYPDLIIKGDQSTFLQYETIYNKLTSLNPERYIINGHFNQDAIMAFDCTNVLLYGLDRVSFSNFLTNFVY